MSWRKLARHGAGLHSANHSQLCLAGWGGNFQQWETSAMGSFEGNHFCYDQETAHGRSSTMTISVHSEINSMGGKVRLDGLQQRRQHVCTTHGKNGGLMYYKRVTTRFKRGPILPGYIFRRYAG